MSMDSPDQASRHITQSQSLTRTGKGGTGNTILGSLNGPSGKKMALPTFFVIGASKAGTTSLHIYLDQSPEIHMSRIKETNFFLSPNDSPHSDRIEDLREYERLFRCPARARGESSPSYSMYPRHKGVPERIAALVPDARFIYLVRNPIDRIVSHYMHNVATSGVRQTFDDHVGDLCDPDNPYVYPCLYAMQMEQYYRVFDRSRMLVIDHAEFLQKRDATLKTIFRFLDVNDVFYTPLFDTEHGTASELRQLPVRFWRLRKNVGASPLRLIIPRSVRRPVRRIAEHALWPAVKRPLVSEAARRQVAHVCGPDIARLREYTGKEFSAWEL
jgi:Sulfotransferase family